MSVEIKVVAMADQLAYPVQNDEVLWENPARLSGDFLVEEWVADNYGSLLFIVDNHHDHLWAVKGLDLPANGLTTVTLPAIEEYIMEAMPS
jgi:hypothetical protein